MDSALVTLILIVFLGALGFILSRRNAKEAKKIGAKIYTVAVHLYGIPGMGEKELVSLFFADDKLVIKSKKKTFDLFYNKLTAIKAVKQTDLIQKDRSVIGRGVAGGLLLGPAAAIVGGLSAVGRKKNVKGELLIINYLPSEGEEPKVIIFDLQKLSNPKRIEKFVQGKRPELIEPDHVTL